MREKGTISNMKRFLKFFLTVAMALVMLLGDAGTLKPAGVSAESVPGAAFTVFSSGGMSGSADNLQLQARSKKKKNTPTPSAVPSLTPAPGESAETESPAGPEQNAPEQAADPTPTPVPEGPIIDPQSIADYLFSHDMQLPENFITKKEAQRLGWDNRVNYVSDVAPGKSIGGDSFGNYEGRLPQGKGIYYHEADCYYTKGRRNATRVVFSSEGRVWFTEDHYNSFTELFPTVP